MRKVQGYGLEMGLHSFKVSTLMNVCINALVCVKRIWFKKGHRLVYGLYIDECVHKCSMCA